MFGPFTKTHLKSQLLLKKSHFKEFIKIRNRLLAKDKIFCHRPKIVQDNLSFALDKNTFVCTEGRGIRVNLIKVQENSHSIGNW